MYISFLCSCKTMAPMSGAWQLHPKTTRRIRSVVPMAHSAHPLPGSSRDQGAFKRRMKTGRVRKSRDVMMSLLTSNAEVCAGGGRGTETVVCWAGELARIFGTDVDQRQSRRVLIEPVPLSRLFCHHPRRPTRHDDVVEDPADTDVVWKAVDVAVESCRAAVWDCQVAWSGHDVHPAYSIVIVVRIAIHVGGSIG